VRGWQGFAVGFVGLSLLYLVLSSNNANIPGLLAAPGKAAQWFLDPTVPSFAASSPAAPSYAPGPLGPQGATPLSVTTPSSGVILT
jgi:hypothetical protein